GHRSQPPGSGYASALPSSARYPSGQPSPNWSHRQRLPTQFANATPGQQHCYGAGPTPPTPDVHHRSTRSRQPADLAQPSLTAGSQLTTQDTSGDERLREVGYHPREARDVYLGTWKPTSAALLGVSWFHCSAVRSTAIADVGNFVEMRSAAVPLLPLGVASASVSADIVGS